MNDPWEGYRAVTTSAGLRDRSSRIRLRIAGPDRVRFLNNLTTNDVKRLAAGQGQESFVTSPQGKTLGYVTLLATDDAILLRTDPAGLEQVRPHLEKYGVFDEVAFDDVSGSTFELHLAGPCADAVLRATGGELPAAADLAHRETLVGTASVRVVRESPTGRPGFTLLGRAEDASAVTLAVLEAGKERGVATVSPEAFEALRIEAGTPVFGLDVTPDNLPQEVGRDDRAINFVKGCYLGQETVARIDALGHVNKLLKGLKIREATSIPPPGTPLETLDGKKAGVVVSSAPSRGWGFPLALAYVRTAQAVPGTELRLALPGSSPIAVVSDLPMLPP